MTLFVFPNAIKILDRRALDLSLAPCQIPKTLEAKRRGPLGVHILDAEVAE